MENNEKALLKKIAELEAELKKVRKQKKYEYEFAGNYNLFKNYNRQKW